MSDKCKYCENCDDFFEGFTESSGSITTRCERTESYVDNYDTCKHFASKSCEQQAKIDQLERENAELKKAFRKLIHVPTSGSDAPETWVSEYASATLTKLKGE